MPARTRDGQTHLTGDTRSDEVQDWIRCCAHVSKQRLDQYRERNQCSCNDELSAEGVWLPQYAFLGGRKLMDQIADAMVKVYENRDQLVKL